MGRYVLLGINIPYFNPFVKGESHYGVVEDLDMLNIYTVCVHFRGDISSIFPSNTEANVSELQGGFEEMFPRY